MRGSTVTRPQASFQGPGSRRGRLPLGLRLLVLRGAVLVAVLCVIPYWLRGVKQMKGALREGREKPLAAIVGAERGPGFLEAVEEIRRTIPPDGAYLVVVEPYGRGALTAIAFRHALLPRKPVLRQRYNELAGSPSVRPLATVVIQSDEAPPVVIAGAGLVERFDPGAFGVEDRSLPAAVDEVVFESNGRIRIRGWCQGFGGVPCDVGAVLVDGKSVPISAMDRVPRRDVEAVVPSVGPCPRAGYKLVIPAGVATGDRVSVEVVFRTADRRWRLYPPRGAERVR